MSSASKPPISRNTSAVAPYMMPIFLWSTVVTHERQPVVEVGRAKTPAGRSLGSPSPEGRASGRASVSAMECSGDGEGRSDRRRHRLVQRLEEGDQLVDLRLGETEVGHAASALGVHRL